MGQGELRKEIKKESLYAVLILVDVYFDPDWAVQVFPAASVQQPELAPGCPV